MASAIELEFLKVLACVAWADGEVSTEEINFIKQFVRRFDLTGEEWTQVQLYLEEPVEADEMKRVTRRFVDRVRGTKQRQKLVAAVEAIAESDGNLAARERAWIADLKEIVSEARKSAFFLDGLKSLVKIGGAGSSLNDRGRENNLHDFVHNRVLFKLRRAVGPERLEREGSPEKLKRLTLSAALLARIGNVDESFLPQEETSLKTTLREIWGASPAMAEAVCRLAIETVAQGVGMHRLVQEAKTTMTAPQRKQLVDAMFALAKAEGKASHDEIEEIRSLAFSLDFSHKDFIESKLRVLRGEKRRT